MIVSNGETVPWRFAARSWQWPAPWGVERVGLVGYLVAIGTPPKTAIPAASAVRTVTTVIMVGDDGATSKTTTTKLAPGTAIAGTAASAVTATGGSTVVKQP